MFVYGWHIDRLGCHSEMLIHSVFWFLRYQWLILSPNPLQAWSCVRSGNSVICICDSPWSSRYVFYVCESQNLYMLSAWFRLLKCSLFSYVSGRSHVKGDGLWQKYFHLFSIWEDIWFWEADGSTTRDVPTITDERDAGICRRIRSVSGLKH